MTKEAFLAGFVKEARDAGVPEEGILALWKDAVSYPPFREEFDKMASDGQIIPGESLNTIANLSNIKKQQTDIESAGSQVALNNV